jgi:hypothetical protein
MTAGNIVFFGGDGLFDCRGSMTPGYENNVPCGTVGNTITYCSLFRVNAAEINLFRPGMTR